MPPAPDRPGITAPESLAGYHSITASAAAAATGRARNGQLQRTTSKTIVDPLGDARMYEGDRPIDAPCRAVLRSMTPITEEVAVILVGWPCRQTGSDLRGESLLDPQRASSDQTEMSERLLDGLPLLGRAGCDAPPPAGPVRCTARRYAAKGLDMRDPAGFRDEAVATLNKLLYLTVGGH